jgi:hypothetical protein
MRSMACFTLVAILTCPQWVRGQNATTDIEKKLDTQFVLTKITADNTDIVTPGSVLVLHKDGLVMYSVNLKVPPTNTYKDGKLSIGFGSLFTSDVALGQVQPGTNHTNVPQRKFVAGEKFWVVASTVKDDGVTLLVYSDPYQDVRYFAVVKFPFSKKSIPPADDVLKSVAEVVTVDPGNNAAENQQPPPAQPQSDLKPIPPPPPPVDSQPAPTKTIALGQTKDQVVAIFGPPQKVANLGAKEIDYYPDMKVTFVDGKVTDVQ